MLNDSIHMRAATAGDLQALVALLSAEGLPDGGVSEGITHFQVLVDADEVIGAAGIEPLGASALLRSVVVAPSHRGRGLARRLTGHMVEHARGLGHDSIYLLTMDADAYFAGLGFTRVPRDEAPVEVKTCEQYREQCPDSAVLMRMTV